MVVNDQKAFLPRKQLTVTSKRFTRAQNIPSGQGITSMSKDYWKLCDKCYNLVRVHCPESFRQIMEKFHFNWSVRKKEITEFLMRMESEGEKVLTELDEGNFDEVDRLIKAYLSAN